MHHVPMGMQAINGLLKAARPAAPPAVPYPAAWCISCTESKSAPTSFSARSVSSSTSLSRSAFCAASTLAFCSGDQGAARHHDLGTLQAHARL